MERCPNDVWPEEDQSMWKMCSLPGPGKCLHQHGNVSTLRQFSDKQNVGPIFTKQLDASSPQQRLVAVRLKTIISTLRNYDNAFRRYLIYLLHVRFGCLGRHDDRVCFSGAPSIILAVAEIPRGVRARLLLV